MQYQNQKLIDCTVFEELLSEYLDKNLDAITQKAVAGHALSCPLCHALLNDVKTSLRVCRELGEPLTGLTRLEATILERTAPQTSMACSDFEESLTDYLDGFLPATVFHRWERHAVLCNECTDLPGVVVRSLAACVSYKLEEYPVPAGLHDRILRATIGTEKAVEAKASAAARLGDWVRSLQFPISVPQLAPVAMMALFAFFVFSQTVSADGSLADVYSKSFALAEQTYKQGADVLGGATAVNDSDQESHGNE